MWPDSIYLNCGHHFPWVYDCLHGRHMAVLWSKLPALTLLGKWKLSYVRSLSKTLGLKRFFQWGLFLDLLDFFNSFSFFHFFFLNAYSCYRVLCMFLLYNEVNQLYGYIYPSLDLSPTPCPHCTPLGHQRAPSWALYTILQVPTSYLFYTWQCIDVKPKLPIHPTLSLLLVSTCPFSMSVSLFLPWN